MSTLFLLLRLKNRSHAPPHAKKDKEASFPVLFFGVHYGVYVSLSLSAACCFISASLMRTAY